MMTNRLNSINIQKKPIHMPMKTQSAPSRRAQRRIMRIEAPAARSCAYSVALDVILEIMPKTVPIVAITWVTAAEAQKKNSFAEKKISPPGIGADPFTALFRTKVSSSKKLPMTER